MASKDTTAKAEKPEAWRQSVVPEAVARQPDSEEAFADDAMLRLYAEMMEHAIHPEPDSSC